MSKNPLPKEENIYETECPMLYEMGLIGQKWKLPITAKGRYRHNRYTDRNGIRLLGTAFGYSRVYFFVTGLKNDGIYDTINHTDHVIYFKADRPNRS
ncbi:MAG: hypothetical protein IJV50_03055 [Lachnospiraceae bacterium]|nr:hypothetical protein [Lachnospiraceae bacterium]